MKIRLTAPQKAYTFCVMGIMRYGNGIFCIFLHIVCVVRLGIEAKRGENSTVLVYVCFFV